MNDKRRTGTILFYMDAPEDQQRARRFDIVQGMLRDDESGWIFAWKLGHSYRDFTTPDKLQQGCRVTFEISPTEPCFVTALSYQGVGAQ